MVVFRMSGKQYQKEIGEGENENHTKHDIVTPLSYKNVLNMTFIF